MQKNYHPLNYLNPDFWKLTPVTLRPIIQSVIKSYRVYLPKKLCILLTPLQSPILPFLVYSFIIFA